LIRRAPRASLFPYTTLFRSGSRLRRVSEYFIAEVNKVYEYHGIEFEAGWFPLFFLLSTREELSIKAISATLSVSHSASSQLVSQDRKSTRLNSSHVKISYAV